MFFPKKPFLVMVCIPIFQVILCSTVTEQEDSLNMTSISKWIICKQVFQYTHAINGKDMPIIYYIR